MWADNAASNPYFGNAYVCYAAFQGNGAQPLTVLTSQGGGSSCALHQVTPASNNAVQQECPMSFGNSDPSGVLQRPDSLGGVPCERGGSKADPLPLHLMVRRAGAAPTAYQAARPWLVIFHAPGPEFPRYILRRRARRS
jgi:hypothetical protein